MNILFNVYNDWRLPGLGLWKDQIDSRENRLWLESNTNNFYLTK